MHRYEQISKTSYTLGWSTLQLTCLTKFSFSWSSGRARKAKLSKCSVSRVAIFELRNWTLNNLRKVISGLFSCHRGKDIKQYCLWTKIILSLSSKNQGNIYKRCQDGAKFILISALPSLSVGIARQETHDSSNTALWKDTWTWIKLSKANSILFYTF